MLCVLCYYICMYVCAFMYVYVDTIQLAKGDSLYLVSVLDMQHQLKVIRSCEYCMTEPSKDPRLLASPPFDISIFLAASVGRAIDGLKFCS